MFLIGRVLLNLRELLLYAQHSHQTDFVVDTLPGAEVTAVSKMESLCRENVFSFTISMSY